MSETHSSQAAHVRIYLAVFGALMLLTVVTVFVSHLGLPPVAGILVGLAIATLKAGLVATYFMHLKWERPLIYGLLGLTVFFMAVLLILPVIDNYGMRDTMIHGETSTSAGAEHH